MRDTQNFVELIYQRNPAVYDSRGIEPPRLKPGAHQNLARVAYETHSHPPTCSPEDLLEAEKFVLVNVPSTKCGVSTKDWAAIRRGHDWRLACLLGQHERTHGWSKRVWVAGEFTEADVWLATAEMCFPRTRPGRAELLKDHPYLPRWFLAQAILIEAA